MPHTIRARVQEMISHFWDNHDQQSYSATRDFVLRHYPQLYPPSSEGEWERWQRDEVMRAVQQIFEDMS